MYEDNTPAAAEGADKPAAPVEKKEKTREELELEIVPKFSEALQVRVVVAVHVGVVVALQVRVVAA